jgi:hypothetical protein
MKRRQFILLGDVRIGCGYEIVDHRLHVRSAAFGRRRRPERRSVALQLPLVRRVSTTRGAIMLLEQL